MNSNDLTHTGDPAELYEIAENSLREWMAKAKEEYPQLDLSLPTLDFTIKGKTAGQARPRENRIRLNFILFKENLKDFVENTIPHELAHLISYALYGRAGNGHGNYWKLVMINLGLEPDRCHNYDVTNATVRTVKRMYEYTCNCSEPHMLTKIKHNRIQRGGVYVCRRCNERLKEA